MNCGYRERRTAKCSLILVWSKENKGCIDLLAARAASVFGRTKRKEQLCFA